MQSQETGCSRWQSEDRRVACFTNKSALLHRCVTRSITFANNPKRDAPGRTLHKDSVLSFHTFFARL
jgi:hypothetical protein